MIVPGLQFGAGTVLSSPQLTSGNPPANPTPLRFGVLQNVKMTLGAEIKSLFGNSQWAVDSAVGKRTIKGSFEFAQISNLLMSQLFFADPTTTGVVVTTTFPGELQQVPATSTYTITVDNAGEFFQDFGVAYAATGVPFKDVGSGSLSGAGQYKVNLSTGVYTFDVADASAEVLINYSWTAAEQGDTLVVQAHPMGWGPVVGLNLVFPYEGGGMGFWVPNARLGKIDIATKLDDYAMYTVDFEGFAGAAGQPFTSYQAF